MSWETTVPEKGIKHQGTEYQPTTKPVFLLPFVSLKTNMEEKLQEGNSGAVDVDLKGMLVNPCSFSSLRTGGIWMWVDTGD